MPKYLYKRIEKESKNSFKKKNSNSLNHKKNRLKNLLFYHPLGTEKSFIIEIFNFSKKNWKNMFISFSYTIYDELNGPLVYSGYNIFKNRGHNIRKYFAHIFPSSYIFVMKNG